MRFLLFLLPALLLAGHAEAHAVLIDSIPAANAAISAGQTAITLRYNSRIDRGRSLVTLSSAGSATPAKLAIARDGSADEIRTSATTHQGPYVLHWQVLATDGHITRGDVPFTVR